MSTKKYADIELRLYELLQKHKVTTGFVKHKYLVMELISTDLDDLMKQSRNARISMKSVLMIGLQVVDRLEALHRIGFLHRDVKPDNLAIGLNEKSRVIYLFDFGLAHPIGAERP
ncbi:uncharacterized protein LOC116244881 [Nymphaea colorata]|nr:uncharacterized protein LOC116244881 [Nymphaea colorata]